MILFVSARLSFKKRALFCRGYIEDSIGKSELYINHIILTFNPLSPSFISQETWKPCVTWIEGRQVEDFKHIDALNTIVQTGIRKLFSVVTKDQLYADVGL